MSKRVGSVWWIEEAGLGPETPPLPGGRDADVAIVGGGYCGLWTALALKERDPGLDVVVLERAFCGHGPSGRNGGFLHGWWASLPALRETFGNEGALTLARASEGAVPAVRALGADVWLREAGMVKVSAAPAQDAALARSLQAALELGVREEAVGLSPDEVAERCRSPVFRAGVLFRDGATVQPARLAKALRSAALDAGVAVHEGTPVIRVRPGDPNVLETPSGTVRAREAVLCVNADAARWGPLRRRLTAFHSDVVLTEPVADRLEEIGWTGGEAIVDARMFLHYFRTTADGRVLMGSGSGPIAARATDDAATIARAEAGLRRLLPALAGARVTHGWGGPIDVSADRFPWVGTLPNRRVRYAAGFSGNGVGPSWLAAQVLASLAAGADDEWTRLPLVDRPLRRGLPPEPLKRLGGSVIRAAALAVEEAEEAERRPPPGARALAGLPRLLGIRLGTR